MKNFTIYLIIAYIVLSVFAPVKAKTITKKIVATETITLEAIDNEHIKLGKAIYIFVSVDDCGVAIYRDIISNDIVEIVEDIATIGTNVYKISLN